MHPRFTIHSWNDDGTVNEPWMYPEVTPIIRDAMALRYRLMPYLYNLLWQAHNNDEPMLRPTFLDHEQDSNTFAECDDFMLGKDLLVASVVEQGQRERDVYLPANESGWYDFYTGQWFSGNQTITLPAPLERVPLLVKAGAVLPTSDRVAYSNSQEDTTRNLEIFPLQGMGTSSVTLFDDDGETNGYQNEQFLQLDVEMCCDLNTVSLTVSGKGKFQPAYQAYKLVLPAGEQRQLVINGKTYQNGEQLPLTSLLNA